MGVGVFPENLGFVHMVVSVAAFLFGCLSAMVAYRLEKPPLTYFSVVMGVIGLVALVFFYDTQAAMHN